MRVVWCLSLVLTLPGVRVGWCIDPLQNDGSLKGNTGEFILGEGRRWVVFPCHRHVAKGLCFPLESYPGTAHLTPMSQDLSTPLLKLWCLNGSCKCQWLLLSFWGGTD